MKRFKQTIYFVLAEFIDEDYKGNLKILLFNHSYNDFHIKKGTRIAQLIRQKI